MQTTPISAKNAINQQHIQFTQPQQSTSFRNAQVEKTKQEASPSPFNPLTLDGGAFKKKLEAVIGPTRVGANTVQLDHLRTTNKLPVTSFCSTLENSFVENISSYFSNNKKGVVIDHKAQVFSRAILSENEQANASRSIINTANRLSLITTYAINIIPKGNLSPTLKAMLDGISARQEDDNFTFVLAYNKSKGVQNWFLGKKRTEATQKVDKDNPGNNPWLKAISIYNKLDGVTPISNLKANVILVGLNPSGPAGSHHSKVLVNDNGVLGVTGASLAHLSKENQIDSGVLLSSQHLAAQELDYFANETLKYASAISKVRVQNEDIGLEKLNISSFQKEFNESRAVSESLNHRSLELSQAIEEEFGVHRNKVPVVLLHNKPSANLAAHLTNKMTDKPIGVALSQLFNTAEKGDVMKIRNQFLGGDARKLIISALAKGVDVKILAVYQREQKKNQEALFKEIEQANLGTEAGKISFISPNPHEAFESEHNLSMKVKYDHAKTYILEKGDKNIILSGTYNLDDQSIYRSSESAILIETNDNALKNSLFDELWEASTASILSRDTL